MYTDKAPSSASHPESPQGFYISAFHLGTLHTCSWAKEWSSTDPLFPEPCSWLLTASEGWGFATLRSSEVGNCWSCFLLHTLSLRAAYYAIPESLCNPQELALVQLPFHAVLIATFRANVSPCFTYLNPRSRRSLLCPATLWKNFRHRIRLRLQKWGSQPSFHHAGGCLNLCTAAQGEPSHETDFPAVRQFNQLTGCHMQCVDWFCLEICAQVYMYAHLSLSLIYLYIYVFTYMCMCGEQKRPGGTELIRPSLLWAFCSVGYGKSSKPQLTGWVG